MASLSFPMRQASSCHSEPKGWGPLRLYHIAICIFLCTKADSNSHCSSCQTHHNWLV
jgi:hypothetical protein